MTKTEYLATLAITYASGWLMPHTLKQIAFGVLWLGFSFGLAMVAAWVVGRRRDG